MKKYNLETGVRSVWQTDTEYQRACLEGIIRNVRKVPNEEIVQMHANYLQSQGAFYVHNDTYMVERFGDYITDPDLGLYRYNRCTLVGRLAIPLRYMDDSVRGFVGYSKKPSDFPDDESFIKYLYPPKDAFDKSRYMYMTAEEYKQALADGYVCIVDGIFDKIILQCLGINTVSLCGSALTKWHTRYLNFIKHKIVIADNDIAGRNLASKCKYFLTDCVEIIQSEEGDIDAFLRTDSALQQLKQCFSRMRDENFILSHKLYGSKENKYE